MVAELPVPAFDTGPHWFLRDLPVATEYIASSRCSRFWIESPTTSLGTGLGGGCTFGGIGSGWTEIGFGRT